MDITQIDIYALECLHLVVKERSVTRAGDKLGISQPSMSNVIARLRRVTGDPLIIRGPDGMTPTPFAEALVTTVGGLAVAVPAVMAYNLFVNRLGLFAGELEGFAQEIVGTLAREGRI